VLRDAPNDGEEHNRLAYGTIERGTDAWEILRDIARWLRNPILVGLPAGARQPDSSDHIIGTGFSQSGALVNQFMVQGENNHTPRPYDAFLVQFQGGVCWQRNDTAPFYGGGAACARVPTVADRNGALAMVVASESDMLVRRGFFSRGIGVPDYVQYEVAGTPHLPKPIFDVSGEFAAVNQIPVDARPLFRGAFRNIARWLNGAPPPAGRYIDGALAADGARFVITRDADGNATGGMRLPHMPSIDPQGGIAGVPLGTYHGTDTTDPANVFRLLAGVFTPFSQAELDARYPSDGPNTIKKRVKRAVRQLFEGGFITADDRSHYKDDPHGPN
jgi:alpha/beta hydrolase family protein